MYNFNKLVKRYKNLNKNDSYKITLLQKLENKWFNMWMHSGGCCRIYSLKTVGGKRDRCHMLIYNIKINENYGRIKKAKGRELFRDATWRNHIVKSHEYLW